ncbi:MAG: xanthine dehydrogenase family protein subunit M [Candidatus Acidiferrales bacterium]
MRSFIPAYEMRTPATLAETLNTLAREPGVWRPFAGGTDLMVLLEAGKLSHRRFLNIWKLQELRRIVAAEESVTIGGLATYTDIQSHPVLAAEFPLLCRAAAETGSVATQNRGTLGGNIANASPAADSPPALMVYDASLELVSAAGSRWLPYEGFHTGYKQMLLRPDELIARIRLPRGKKNWIQQYAKVGTRKAQAISKVCLAAAALIDEKAIRDVRIAFGSVAPTVVRATAAEAALRGQRLSPSAIDAARAALKSDIAPIDDIRSTARYRLRVAQNLLAEFLKSLEVVS